MFKVFKSSFSKGEYFLFIILFIFSFALMFKTFRVSSEGELMFATKVWSDFAATIPLIRSFSKGFNFPPQYPIYAGPHIRYHFIFYLIVGTLEKIGLPLNWALNLPSALSFFVLLLTIYFFSKYLFKSKAVATLSVVFFLFNGSFSFLEFFKKHPFPTLTLNQIIKNTQFPSFGPYDRKIVSAFWNLNIYTNQRHLALAYLLFFLVLYMVFQGYKKPKKFTYKKAVLIGFIVGLFPFLHLAVFGMLGVMLLTSFFVFPKIRTKIFLTGCLALLLAIPQILYMGNSNLETKLINPGYLIENLTFLNFSKYWFLNLGFVSILAPAGLLIANKDQRKVFFIFLVLFVVGNIFQFSSEIAANHKFFNLFLINANMFASLILVKMWKRNTLFKATVVFYLLLMTLSGIIDIFPIFNDKYINLPDISKSKTSNYILKNTPKNSVFLNASFLYDPASLAGRKIYLGWPYFSWSAGYDTSYRHNLMKEVLFGNDRELICDKLEKEGVDYLEIKNPTDLEDVKINYDFFDLNFKQVFYDEETRIKIFDVNSSCK